MLHSSFKLFPSETLAVFVFFSRDPLYIYYKKAIEIWLVFGSGHMPLKLKCLINFSVQRPTSQSSLVNDSLSDRLITEQVTGGDVNRERKKGINNSPKKTNVAQTGDRIKLVQISV